MLQSARELGTREQLLSAAVRVQALSFDGLELVSLRLPARLWLDRCSFVGAELEAAILEPGTHLPDGSVY
ncbi:hypothetical protein [Modestobacter sp. URMC 112]